MVKKVLLFIFVIISTICLMSGIYIFYVANNVPPIIELNGKDTITINVGETYQDEGATATYLDFDVTDKISVDNTLDINKTGTYKITYKIKLKYIKLTSTEVRTINVIDANSPIITLTKNEITIDQNTKYNEPGYKATDSYDGDLTDQVKIENKVDTKTPGEYKVIYQVQDSSGNTFETSRKVIVRKTTTTTKKTTTTTKDPNKLGDTGKVTTKKGSGEGIPILMYHYFFDSEAGETGKDSNWMDVKDFEKQLKYLSDNNYYYPTWQEVYDFVEGKITLPSKSVVITMDDGHKSIYAYAIPLLEKYKVKATAFIITSKDNAKKIKKYTNHEYIEFQSHTHNMHQGGCSGGHGGLFRCISYDKGLADLKKSIEFLGKSDALAYPFGDVTKNVLTITKDANFKVGVTTQWGYAKKGADPLQLPRVRMYKGIALSTFKSNVK